MVDSLHVKLIKSFKSRPTPLLLHCGIQNYDWGERGPGSYIPKLLNFKPVKDRPYAELWIGAHPLRPSEVEIPSEQKPIAKFSDWIRQFPLEILGERVNRKFGGQLPFLLKVLAVSKALSLQVHPGRDQASEGFLREQAQSISIGDPHRNYKDDRHKPELIVAITDFYMLNRFSRPAEIRRRLQKWKELIPVFSEAVSKGDFGADAVQHSYEKVMEMNPGHLDPHLKRWVSRIESRCPDKKEDVEHWILRADREHSHRRFRDRGLLAFLFLNFLKLKPGQGCYLKAGELHTYLEGVGVEAMANSDNVLRGGLTSKHIDVSELLKTLTYRSDPVQTLVPDRAGTYPTAAEEFELSVIELEPRKTWRSGSISSVEILLVLEGNAVLSSGAGVRDLKLHSGSVVAVPACLKAYEFSSVSGKARIFKCSVPAE